MSREIFLENHQCEIEIGAFAEERGIIQSVSFDIRLSLIDYGRIDDESVDKILSYDVIIEAIQNCLTTKRYNLLEALAEDIADQLTPNPQVLECEIVIRKLDRANGALGYRMITKANQNGEKIALGTPSHVAIVNCDHHVELGDADEKIDFYFPILSAQATEPLDQQLLRLQYDAAAWRLGDQLGLPVVDTDTEAVSLINRNQCFVRAPGKAIFAHPSEKMNAQSYFDWLIKVHNVTDFTPLGDKILPELNFSSSQ